MRNVLEGAHRLGDDAPQSLAELDAFRVQGIEGADELVGFLDADQ